jgi:hypothetical protein
MGFEFFEKKNFLIVRKKGNEKSFPVEKDSYVDYNPSSDDINCFLLIPPFFSVITSNTNENLNSEKIQKPSSFSVAP